MPAVDAIADQPEELRRTLRDVVALSMLPATWGKQDARLIAESVTEVLVRMLGLDFAYVALHWDHQPSVCVARTAERGAPDHSAAIRHLLLPVLDLTQLSDVFTLDSPTGSGPVRAVANPIVVGRDSIVVAASCRSEFPTPGQRLLLGIAANQAAIAIRRWQAEQDLQLLNETLEQRVEAEVEGRLKVENAFRQAQKMEAIGQLTGGIAYDFNNLLAAVLGNLGLLRKRLGDDPRALDLLASATEGAERGKALTQRLLAFARQQDLKPATIHVPKLIEDAIAILAPSIGPLVEIRTALAPDLWPLCGDANQLELALLNLVLNARDAMPEGGTIVLSARNETIAQDADQLAPGDYVCLAVADTGAGMDQATLARAADPLFTTKGVGKGTGPGLSMVEGMAAQSGGSLRLSSSMRGGTTAELRLPRAERPPAASAAVETATTTPTSCTILLVDDDALICSTTASMLNDLGHQVVKAASGKKALEILQGGTRFDFVLTDQAMPGMTGQQLATQIRASWPDLPVLLATGYAELPDADGLHLPRLSKPYGEEELARAIDGLMRGRRQAS